MNRTTDRAGIALPLVLLLLVALAGAALSALVVARTELLLERGNLRYLERRLRGERAPTPDTVPLPGGFALLLPPEEIGPRAHSVVFLLDPDSLAAGLPGALEVGLAPAGAGVLRGDPSCVGGSGGWPPLVRVRPPGVPADPPVPPPPRLGPLGIADLPGPGDAVVHLPPGARIEEGAGAGLLIGAGDLVLAGEARFRGVVLVAGDLRLEGAAAIEGVVLVGGRATLAEGGRIVGCPAAAAAALRATLPRRVEAVPGGRLLGAF